MCYKYFTQLQTFIQNWKKIRTVVFCCVRQLRTMICTHTRTHTHTYIYNQFLKMRVGLGVVFVRLLWSPYVIGQTIIFMAALCNRGALYFCPVVSFFLSSSSSFSSSSSIFYLLFFPRLISAATDWISTILLHMAWP